MLAHFPTTISRHKLQRIGKNEQLAERKKPMYALNKNDVIYVHIVSCIDRHNNAIQYAELIEATFSSYLFFFMEVTMIRISIRAYQRLRGELQMMKRYLVFCPDADFQGLPWRTGLRTHLIENSSNYSIKDLVDLQSGVLMEEIRTAYDSMRNHITEVCELCRARGHLCELCGNDEVIYPWDTSAISCQQCAAVHHRVCWAKRNNSCPRCTRIQQRLALKSEDTPDNAEDDLLNDRH